MLERLAGHSVQGLVDHNERVPVAPMVIRTTGRKIPEQGGLGKCQLSVRTFTLTSETCVPSTWPRTWCRDTCEASLVFIPQAPGVLVPGAGQPLWWDQWEPDAQVSWRSPQGAARIPSRWDRTLDCDLFPRVPEQSFFKT